MKTTFKCSLSVLIFALVITRLPAQDMVSRQSIEICYNKTSSIIFNAGIVSVDRGSADVLAQKAKKVNNVLQLKASRKNFPETNLSVITGDGRLHVFTVSYNPRPSGLVLQMHDSSKVSERSCFSRRSPTMRSPTQSKL